MYNSKIHLTITLVFAVTACISISAFDSLVNKSMGIMSYAIGLNICPIISRIKKYKSIIKKQKKEHNETALLAKTKLDCKKGLISKPLTYSYIGSDDFLLIDLLRKNGDMKEKANKL